MVFSFPRWSGFLVKVIRVGAVCLYIHFRRRGLPTHENRLISRKVLAEPSNNQGIFNLNSLFLIRMITREIVTVNYLTIWAFTGAAQVWEKWINGGE